MHRRGFALHQLILVIAVLAVLAGLLLPAIQRMRLAAARMASSNNLKQLMIGVHNYHDNNKGLPSGVDAKNFSAHMHLLPYIEQEAVYKAIIGTGGDADSKAVRKLGETVIKTLISPLDEVQPVAADSAGTNYLFVAGTRPELKDNDGLFYRGSTIRFASVKDGLSNTVAILETLRGDGKTKALTVRRQHVRLTTKELKGIKDTAGAAEWKAGKNIVGDRGNYWVDGRFLRGTIAITRPFNSPSPDVDCGGEGGLSAVRSIYPFTIVAMCDGSVRAIQSDIKFAPLKAAATRNGREALPADF